MEKEQEQLEALQDIRKIMKESSKFLSLSGLSGVFAGVYALIAAYFGNTLVDDLKNSYTVYESDFETQKGMLIGRLLFICLTVLTASILTAFYFSGKKAKQKNQKLFDHTSKKLLWHMAVPLATGGAFCLALLFHGQDMVFLISPVMLIFYGLALVGSSKFTVHDIKYLGYLELCLGIAASFLVGYGLLFWAIGFGFLHIIYGTIMWYKYERKG